ncbi:MAG: hypothetical protein ACXWJK_09170 [Burkholderiaceae bacterium]
MTRKNTPEQRISTRATRPSNSILKGNLNTTNTTFSEGPKVELGTDNLSICGLKYEPLPPVKEPVPAKEVPYWTFEKGLAVFSGIAVIVTVVSFFIYLQRDVSDIKTDVKDTKDKLGRLDEKTNKQTGDIEQLTGSIQRLEGEVRRTQDYIQQKKR